ncbi:MAG: lipoprotein-releasing ABC transporter permease subunit [Thermodesulfobacteriota bacterium]|nr:lipoprotein-releasing ABC transporter permease subunit [Thermodesulfobacteriota bacterium]
MMYELFIGRRHLMTAKRNVFVSLITLLSVVGVIIGVMALIIVIAVMSGFEADIKARILGIESHVVLSRHGGELHDYERVVQEVSRHPEVETQLPFIMTQVMFRSSYGVSGGLLKGVEPDKAAHVMTIFKNMEPLAEKLRQRTKDQAPGIVLGKELAQRLGVTEGDTVYLVLSMGALSPVGHMPAVKRFAVTGIFEAGMHEYDSAFSYIHLSEAQHILHMDNSVGGIEIRVKDIYRADTVGEQLVARLGYPYYARDWMSMNRNLFSALKLEKTVMFIILTLIILVAAFNIASSLIMIVMNKKREIGILKAMGATRKSIKRIFVIEGMIIGGAGTLLGLCFGVLACLLLQRYQFIDLPDDVYYITTLPVRLELADGLVIALAALAICYLATLYPANQASKVDPVEAIRYG